MRYGVRFCGGCNPRYERGDFLKKLKTDLDGKVSFEVANEEDEYDGLVVLGGCMNCCPEYSIYKSKTDPVLVWDKSHYDETVNKILTKQY